jgi:uncharacterized membrane protein required for colicin V production
MALDSIIIVLVALAAFNGWRKGAISMLASVIIIIGAIILATLFGTPFGRAIGVGPTLLHPVTGFFILFIIILFIGNFIKRWIRPKRGFFAGSDKLLGLLFGALRAILLLGLLAGFLRIFQLPSAKAANESKTYPIVLKASALIISQLKPLASQRSTDVYDDLSPRDFLKK